MQDTHDRLPRPGILEDMTMDEVRGFAPEVVVLPAGSTEPHGSHLPYCTDTIRVRATCEAATVRANARGARVLCYPALPVGLNVNFTGFPLALSMKVPTYMRLLTDLCEQIEAEGVRKIAIINGHGGNTQVIAAFLREWAHRGRPGQPDAGDRAFICLGYPRSGTGSRLVRHPSNHAGEGETLEVMAIAPHLVRQGKARNYPHRTAQIPSLEQGNVVWVKPWHLFLPEGAQGEAREADAERAQQLHEANVEDLARFLVELSEAPWSPTFPYAEEQ